MPGATGCADTHSGNNRSRPAAAPVSLTAARDLPGTRFMDPASHARLQATTLLQLETVVQQFRWITLDTVQLLFHQHQVGAARLALVAGQLAAVFGIRFGQLADQVELFNRIGHTGAFGQFGFFRTGTTRAACHRPWSRSATLVPLVAFPAALLTLFAFIPAALAPGLLLPAVALVLAFFSARLFSLFLFARGLLLFFVTPGLGLLFVIAGVAFILRFVLLFTRLCL